jgi:hypothetical protein
VTLELAGKVSSGTIWANICAGMTLAWLTKPARESKVAIAVFWQPLYNPRLPPAIFRSLMMLFLPIWPSPHQPGFIIAIAREFFISVRFGLSPNMVGQPHSLGEKGNGNMEIYRSR